MWTFYGTGVAGREAEFRHCIQKPTRREAGEGPGMQQHSNGASCSITNDDKQFWLSSCAHVACDSKIESKGECVGTFVYIVHKHMICQDAAVPIKWQVGILETNAGQFP
jgi:hypothetical protein